MAIRLLKDEVIGKIAAGEVVERPSAVIKEMVENSLDAGATAVTVEIRDGGISYIRVTDNGCGIAQSDIRMAFERHATSKLTRAEELHSIATLGFRGEALASVAAVARVTCVTRTRDDISGLKAVNEGGTLLSIEETACPGGTTFTVRDLFYNTPVRLKFLKKPVTEAGYVTDYMMRLIFSRPDVSFRYINQGKTVYHSAGDGDIMSAVYCVYGSETAKLLRPVRGSMNGLMLEGYVGIGSAGRGNRSHQTFCINGRYMRSELLSRALEDACRERVMIGRTPMCILHLTMPYEAVDVNVHPNKLEVRFRDEEGVAEAMTAIVREAITDRDALEKPEAVTLTEPEERHIVNAPPAAVTKTAPAEMLREPVMPVMAQPAASPVLSAVSALLERSRETVPLPTPLAASAPAAPRSVPGPAPAQLPERHQPEAVQTAMQELPGAASPEPRKPETAGPEQLSLAIETESPLRIIGVVFNTFVLAEYEDQLLMIDQHAVHERLLFDRMSAACEKQNPGQEMLLPLIVEVTGREMLLLEENRELLESIGLTIEPFGQHAVSVRTVPMILGQAQGMTFVRDVLDQLDAERGITLDRRRAAILQLACKKAVKGGDALSPQQIRTLVKQMVENKVTPTCPHGRPLVVSLSHTELDRKFRRIQ